MGKLKAFFTGGVPLLLLGAGLCLGGLGLTQQNLQEDRRAGAAAEKAVQALTEYLPEEVLRSAPDPVTEEEILVIENRVLPVQTVDGRDYVGMIQIPSLGLELPVQGSYDYQALEIAPCRYAGDPYHGDMVICAHNYSSHFGSLRELQPGDALTFTAMDGECFYYQVLEQEILSPDSPEEMLTPLGWDLTLFTCTIGGEYRIAVRFVRV